MDNTEIKLSKKERKQLIGKIQRASGVAQYALEEKITDAQVIKISQHLDILSLIKSANTYNRYCQGQKTAEVNAKLKDFIDLEKSEIYKTGKWLLNALSKKGKERQNNLLENNLVHKEDYNHTVTDLTNSLQEHNLIAQEQTNLAGKTIKELEKKNDLLREQLNSIEEYIKFNYGINKWNEIKKQIK